MDHFRPQDDDVAVLIGSTAICPESTVGGRLPHPQVPCRATVDRHTMTATALHIIRSRAGSPVPTASRPPWFAA